MYTQLYVCVSLFKNLTNGKLYRYKKEAIFLYIYNQDIFFFVLCTALLVDIEKRRKIIYTINIIMLPIHNYIKYRYII